MKSQVITFVEQNPGPRKIGRVEIQHSELTPNYLAMLAHCNEKRDREAVGFVLAGLRYERVLDGDNIPHYNIYATYDPPSAAEEALNPRNLNDAPQSVLGQVVDHNAVDIGRKERKF